MALLDYKRVEQSRSGNGSEPAPRMYCDPEVMDFLRDDPAMQDAAREVVSSLMREFPNGSVAYELDYDEDSGNPKLFFKAIVSDYSADSRRQMREWVMNRLPAVARPFSDTFVYLVRRG